MSTHVMMELGALRSPIVVFTHAFQYGFVLRHVTFIGARNRIGSRMERRSEMTQLLRDSVQQFSVCYG